MTELDGMPDRIGPYRLVERIGEGGMGVVFLAHDPGDRTVALKVLRSSIAGDPTARRRLAREVETMRRVRSPYVAEVIGADLADDMPYIVTRYVPGRTLEQVVSEGGPLRGPDLLRLASGLADALAAVHAAGVVHRDLKPSNVMLLNGLPVVIDFGIAQGPDATRLTMTGMFMGTPGYLAPEVIEGSPSSEASDIHAWGATVAFAATGQPPFGTGAFEAIFYRIVNGQPNLDGVPPPIQPLLAAALARDPARRPPAVQLGARAAVLDPGPLVAGNGFGPGQGVAAPVTAMDAAVDVLAPAADAAGRAGAAFPAGPPTALPGTQGAAVADLGAAGFVPQGTRPFLTAPPSPADFADVLPPVEYRPGPAAMPAARGTPSAARAAPARTSNSRGYAVMVFAAMVALASVSVVLPVAGTLAALGVIVVLRASELAQQRATVRRGARGTKPSDPVLTAAAFPWYLIRSLLSCLLLAPFALAAAVIAGGVTIVAVPGHALPRAVAVAAGVLVAFYGLGPGSARSRRQLSRVFAAVVGTRPAQAVALVGITALALAALAAAVSWPSLYWPTGPPGFWHFGVTHLRRAGSLGGTGRFLLSHLRRW
jgi:Protein kinase domain